MMKFLMISCKEASFLTAKKEEGKLSFGESLKLWFHTSMCEFCTRFYKQMRRIGGESPHVHSEEELSPAGRERIEQLIRDQYL
jgi:hypothetical protein